MGMTRERLEEQMLEYLYEELAGEDRAAFEAAISEHPDLQAELEELRESRAQLPPLSEGIPVSRSVRDAVLAEAAEVASRRRSRVPSLWDRFLAGWNQPAFAGALTFVLIAGVGVYVVDFIPSDGAGDPERVLGPARPVPVAAEVPEDSAPASPSPESEAPELELAEEFVKFEQEEGVRVHGAGAAVEEPEPGKVDSEQPPPAAAKRPKRGTKKGLRKEKASRPMKRKGRSKADSLERALLHSQGESKTGEALQLGQASGEVKRDISRKIAGARLKKESASHDAAAFGESAPPQGLGKAGGLSAAGSTRRARAVSKQAASPPVPVPAPASAEASIAPVNEEDEDWVIGDDAKMELARRMKRLARQSPEKRSKRALEVALDLAEEVADWKRMKTLVGWLEESHGVEAGRRWRRILQRR